MQNQSGSYFLSTFFGLMALCGILDAETRVFGLCLLIASLLTLPHFRKRYLAGTSLQSSKTTFFAILGLLFIGSFISAISGNNGSVQSNKVTATHQAHPAKTQISTLPSEKKDYALQIKALDSCKHAIAKFLHADGAGQIPDVQNFGLGNEFEFGWGKGIFQLDTPAGPITLSASCNVRKKPFKVMWLTVNGTTIIENGQGALE